MQARFADTAQYADESFVIRTISNMKIPKETETEETIGVFATFLSLVAFQLGRGTWALPGYAYVVWLINTSN